MADESDFQSLELTLIHGSTKHQVTLPARKDETLTVEKLSQFAENITQVPVDSQKLIFKGKSLQDKDQSLADAGIKDGSKVMLLGKKYNPEEDDNMKALRTAEQQVDSQEKKLESYTEELNGIQNGFLQQNLAKEGVVKISKQIVGLQESLMKLLESLDAMVLGSSTLSIKGKRKTLVQRIQSIISKADTEVARCDAIRKGVNL